MRTSLDSPTSPGPVAADPGPDLVRAQRAVAARAVMQADALDLSRRLALLAASLRWATVSVGLIAGATHARPDELFLASAATLVLFAGWMSMRSPGLDPGSRVTQLAVIVELGLTVAAISMTGGLNSPFLLTPMVPIVLGGYTWGNRELTGIAYAGVTAIAVVVLIRHSDMESQRSAAQLGIVFLLCGVLGAFTRRLVTEAGRRHAEAIDQVARMSTANDLLVALHGVAQTLPASLDLGEVLESTRTRLRTLFSFGTLVVLVRDDLRGRWRVDLADGIRLPPYFDDHELAPAVRAALDAPGPLVTCDAHGTDPGGISPTSHSGLYAPLRARGSVVGLLVLEHPESHVYSPTDAHLIGNLTGALALSVDNALWFARLRNFGAEAERARIARELHDRFAQSLAYVTFELERLAGRNDDAELFELRDVVRGVVTDLRETLYQLRANVTEDSDLAAVAEQYINKFSQRTGIRVEWLAHADQRLPVQVEQELWRIAQESLTNIERHAQASRAAVKWNVADGHARLEVVDNGRGFRPNEVEGEHYGVMGMHERADAIGAQLTIDSRPGRGTRIQVELEVPR